MFELPLVDWSESQRQALSFWLRHHHIDAVWGPDRVSVPDDEEARVLRFAAASISERSPTDVDDAWDRLEQAPIDGMERDPELRFLSSASPALRFGAWIIDGIVITVILVMLPLLSMQLPSWLWLATVSGYIVGFVAVLGQTVGNMVVRTHVERLDQPGPPGFRASFIRYVVPNVVAIPVLFLPDGASGILELIWLAAVYAPILRGPSHRGLHDRAAGVWVKDDRV